MHEKYLKQVLVFHSLIPMIFNNFSYLLVLLLLPIHLLAYTQTDSVPDFQKKNTNDSISGQLSLKQCIRFALQNEPLLRQSLIDQDIAEKDIQLRLADWFPQVNIGNTLEHFIKKPVSAFPNIANPSAGVSYISTGRYNNNTLGLSATQNIFSNSLRIATITARYYRSQASQNTDQVKIRLVANVSKAFYDLLLSRQQLLVIDEDILRLRGNTKIAQALYQQGTNDPIDYDQSIIALNNSISQRFTISETINYKFSYLRQLMGYPLAKPLELQFDSLLLTKETNIDTLLTLETGRRIEYTQLQTTIALLRENYSFYKYNFLPTVSAFGNFNLVNQNDNLNHLFDRNFPNSVIGLTLSLPVFQGNKRIYNMKRAALTLKRSSLDEIQLKNAIQTEYVQALGTYKSFLNQYILNTKNVSIARHVYKVVLLQYQQGIKPYLNLIQAETDLRTSQLNLLNSLFELLSSKLDVQVAAGILETKI